MPCLQTSPSTPFPSCSMRQKGCLQSLRPSKDDEMKKRGPHKGVTLVRPSLFGAHSNISVRCSTFDFCPQNRCAPPLCHVNVLCLSSERLPVHTADSVRPAHASLCRNWTGAADIRPRPQTTFSQLCIRNI